MESITKDAKLMLKFGIGLAVVLMIFLVALTVNSFKETSHIGQEKSPVSTVSFSGKGEAFAAPDTALVSFTITQEASAVADAQAAATKQTNKVLAALKDLGIADKDVKTVSYNISQRYEYSKITCVTYPCPSGERTLKGYDVNEMVEVKIRDISKSGDVLSALGGLGVTNVSGLSFTLDDDSAVTQQAREKAVTDAKKKAEETAQALGVKLGKLVNYSESNYPVPYYSATKATGMGGSADSASVPVATGENTYTVNVTLTYEL